MEESNNTARNVAQAIVAVLEWNCPPDTRKAAVSYLESVWLPSYSCSLSCL